MVFAAGLVAANLLFGLLRLITMPRLPLAFERRDSLLNPQERLCLGTVEEAVGRDFRVFARVAAGAVLAADSEVGRHRRRRSERALAGRAFDFLICAAADAHPLCAVLASAPEPPRRRRRDLALLRGACADAGLPVVELELADGYELAGVRRRLLEAIETADVRMSTEPEPVVADEEALLAELAAAMQEPDGRTPARGSARR